MNPKEIPAYQCSKCKQAYINCETAEKCCAPKPPKLCEDCGTELSPNSYYTACEPCRTKRTYDKAEKLDSWDGWIYREGFGYNEGFFDSIAELIEYCEDRVPEWAFACKEIRHELSIENAIEQMLDDAYEGAGDHLVDVDELHKFVDDWNAKQNIVSYFPDYKRVVLIGRAE